MIVRNLTHNAETARRIIADAVTRVPAERACPCASALATAIITRPDVVPADTKRDLALIVGKYLK
jgi:5'-methylthioadenosine phosphorylase